MAPQPRFAKCAAISSPLVDASRLPIPVLSPPWLAPSRVSVCAFVPFLSRFGRFGPFNTKTFRFRPPTQPPFLACGPSTPAFRNFVRQELWASCEHCDGGDCDGKTVTSKVAGNVRSTPHSSLGKNFRVGPWGACCRRSNRSTQKIDLDLNFFASWDPIGN